MVTSGTAAQDANTDDLGEPMIIDGNCNGEGEDVSLPSRAMDPENKSFVESLSHPLQEKLISILTAPLKLHKSDDIDKDSPSIEAPTSNNVEAENGKMANQKQQEEKQEIAVARADRIEILLKDMLLANIREVLLRDDSQNHNAANQENKSLDKLEQQPSVELGSAMLSLCKFWQESVLVIQHILYFQKKQQELQQSVADEGAVILLKQNQYDYENIGANAIRKLPIALLEDALDVLSIPQAIRFWNHALKPMVDVLFGALLWKDQNAAWLPFLKVGNKFWKRLTTESGVSVSSSNTGSSTTTICPSSVAAADVMWTLATVYPLSEKSAARVWGSFNTDNEAVVESESQYDQQSKKDDENEDDIQNAVNRNESSISSISDYNFYEKFWMLQHDFRNPNGVAVADFLERLKTVVQAFESHPTVVLSSTATFNAAHSQPHHYLPYLTHSRILHTQLKDPVLRVQILTQFCIVAHHLVSQVRSLEPQLATILQTTSKLLHQATSFVSKQNLSKSSNGRKGGDVTNANSRCNYLDILNSILHHSEAQWRHWKQSKCPPASIFEHRFKQQEQHHSIHNVRETTRKRKRENVADSDESYRMLDKDEIIAISRKMHDSVPNYENHLEEYVDALDPDAGIDDEYHPKRNTNFTWQALRLLSTEMLPDFERVDPSGDFENLVRHVYKVHRGTEIPGNGPDAYEWNQIDDEEPNNNEVDGNNIEDQDLKNDGDIEEDIEQASIEGNNESGAPIDEYGDEDGAQAIVDHERNDDLQDDDDSLFESRTDEQVDDNADHSAKGTNNIATDGPNDSGGVGKSTQDNDKEEGEADDLGNEVITVEQPQFSDGDEKTAELHTTREMDRRGGERSQKSDFNDVRPSTQSKEREGTLQPVRYNVTVPLASSRSHRGTHAENASGSSTWNRGNTNDYGGRERDVDRDVRLRQNSAPSVVPKASVERRTQDRVYHHLPDGANASSNEGRRGGIDSGGYDGRRGGASSADGRDRISGRESLDDRLERDDGYDAVSHGRDHRGGDPLNDRGSINPRRVSSLAVRSDDRRGTRRVDDYAAREEWRSSDRGGGSRRGGHAHGRY